MVAMSWGMNSSVPIAMTEPSGLRAAAMARAIFSVAIVTGVRTYIYTRLLHSYVDVFVTDRLFSG